VAGWDAQGLPLSLMWLAMELLWCLGLAYLTADGGLHPGLLVLGWP